MVELQHGLEKTQPGLYTKACCLVARWARTAVGQILLLPVESVRAHPNYDNMNQCWLISIAILKSLRQYE